MMRFKEFFLLRENPDNVYSYNLSTGFDVSTASFSQSFSVASQDTDPKDIAFNSDGTPDKAVDPSDDGTTFKELGFSFTGSEPFTAFALKIVLTHTR